MKNAFFFLLAICLGAFLNEEEHNRMAAIAKGIDVKPPLDRFLERTHEQYPDLRIYQYDPENGWIVISSDSKTPGGTIYQWNPLHLGAKPPISPVLEPWRSVIEKN